MAYLEDNAVKIQRKYSGKRRNAVLVCSGFSLDRRALWRGGVRAARPLPRSGTYGLNEGLDEGLLDLVLLRLGLRERGLRERDGSAGRDRKARTTF